MIVAGSNDLAGSDDVAGNDYLAGNEDVCAGNSLPGDYLRI
jgi:hypothetical protein